MFKNKHSIFERVGSKGLSLKQGKGNRGMGMGNGERGIFKSGNQ